ncbi:vascular cell adhesion protein 1-like [Pristis pectinata]|uniref:vascular cell adhesion protein 1-like n=1 Tax=Pristis pectinata TaxID=685728 RepID=UPI00223DA160|nr:vascular cell adhesion protein 1-like [Pristis pectinata]
MSGDVWYRRHKLTVFTRDITSLTPEHSLFRHSIIMDFRRISPAENIFLLTALFFSTAKVNGFEVRITTNPTAVEFGESLEVTCTTTCSKPQMIVEYKPGIAPNRTRGDNWVTDQFPSVQKWDFTVPCIVICESGNENLEVKKEVAVYNQELNVRQLPGPLEVNKPYQLECTGPRVYPRNKLILTWLRGSEVVQCNSTGVVGFPDEDVRLRNVLSFTASTLDDGQVYTCLAEVDLGSNTTKPITKSSVTLQTYSFPEPPRILNRDPVEVNQEVMLTCEVPNVYPAEKMRVRWFQGDEQQNSVTNRSDPTTVWATAAWTPRETGLTELSCMADFEDYPSVPLKNNSISIEVYVFSDPIIQVPPSLVKIPVNITCSVFNVSGKLQLRMKKGSEILTSRSASTGLTIYHTVNPQAGLNGQQYTCEAKLTLQHHSNPIVKQRSATLPASSIGLVPMDGEGYQFLVISVCFYCYGLYR